MTRLHILASATARWRRARGLATMQPMTPAGRPPPNLTRTDPVVHDPVQAALVNALVDLIAASAGIVPRPPDLDEALREARDALVIARGAGP